MGFLGLDCEGFLTKQQVVIFTDLDGTLLDHEDYSYEAALPALELINKLATPLVLTSSKTRAEVSALRTQLKNRHPFVVENGGALYYPCGYFSGDHRDAICSENFGMAYSKVVNIAHKLRSEMNLKMEGFSDWQISEVAKKTGLSFEDADNAKKRDCGEPVLWYDTDEKLLEFKAELKKYGLRILKGGRFYHVTGRYDKATAVQWLLNAYKELFCKQEIISVAFGDAGNDIEMLRTVDYAMVIRQKDGYRVELDDLKNVYYSSHTGSAGWCEAIRFYFETIRQR
jgi:mannosyl-3-phosphoglycerate phosphatase